jgi:hypothetical protein
VHGYWDPESKQSRTKTIRSVGYLDELEKDYDDPIAHFEALAEKMEAERLESETISLTLKKHEQLERGSVNRKNYGHVIYSKIYHELEIDRFLNNARRHENFKFNTDAIMRLLVFMRLLYPCSKRASHIKKDLFFDSFKFSLDDVYDALTHFDKNSLPLKAHLHEQVTAQYNRKTDIVYYDVTKHHWTMYKQLSRCVA